VELLIDSITMDLDCFDNIPDFAKEAKDAFNKSFEGLWDIYFAKYGIPSPSTSSASLSRSYTRNLMLGLLQQLRENPNKRAENDRLSNNEYDRYARTNLSPIFAPNSLQVLMFWVFEKQRNLNFPLYRK
nr:hypothetical protein [Tanacetum cinerariifolium]